MKLDPNMYVRTKKGFIRKFNGEMFKNSSNVYVCEDINVWNQDIKKASHNIIDLIEVGDVISYIYINEFDDSLHKTYDYISSEKKLKSIISGFEKDIIKKIISIVTKEQFSSMEYKVE